MTHVYGLLPASKPCSSPRMPWSGYTRRISRRIAASASRSATVTGSKPPLVSLFSMPTPERKRGRICSAARSARRTANSMNSRTRQRPQRRHAQADPAERGEAAEQRRRQDALSQLSGVELHEDVAVRHAEHERDQQRGQDRKSVV